MRIHFVLPGLHRVERGAEIAFESVAHELGLLGEEVVLVGSGRERGGRAYRFQHVPAVGRERFERMPKFPLLRNDYMYEELTFVAGLAFRYRRDDADLTVTCSYPYTNWFLRSFVPGRRRPAHVFVTQNGDWPAYKRESEYRFFSCEGLVCTNPLYFERNRDRWRSILMPNGVDTDRFRPGPSDRPAFGLPADRPVVLMVSALVEGERVLEGMKAVSRLPDPFLVVAGDGPLRADVDRLAAQILPGRFLRGTFPHERMPDLYRCADVFLHPALFESFGNVYVEALSTGLPVVANDIGLTRWIFNGHGHLVDATSEEALASALNAATDGAHTGAVERAAFAGSKYSWKSVAGLYQSFFREVVQRSRS
jgi:glycosyltransferase involved in cell wall biosynthesis